jgi:hypothetical protein
MSGIADYFLRKPHPADTCEKPPRRFGWGRRFRGHNHDFGWSGRNHVLLDEYWSGRRENFAFLRDYWPGRRENFAFVDNYRTRGSKNRSFLNNCDLFWIAATCCEECAYADEW